MSENIKTVENEYIITFRSPIKWEETEYKSIDLSGLENLNGSQLCEIHKRFDALGLAAALKEQSPEFAAIAANVVTGIPIEFFHFIPARELNKIKNKVFNYFFTED